MNTLAFVHLRFVFLFTTWVRFFLEGTGEGGGIVLQWDPPSIESDVPRWVKLSS